ncbi:DUF4307 domain-containing protein [Cellulomonas fengjieae]|uniref:DUF4307 domain-containing protein n=1 Tax=Cellulomonas fengjieae TaxID=2819978 RepID=A0ABS3SL76_9CELL|nr:DUF4307 domain-containing protein [Cellulomonas fengjieae]MBO3086501.1 DUF4307 domain-containing protein [Cellulomonas fengjieae]QVI66639.1 DUF4307 domain-containing protein [Cellulomonas fengjieae]
MTESAATRPPAGRYGPEPTARSARRGRIALLAAAVLGIAVALWVALSMASRPVSFKDVGFALDGEQAIDVTFEVTKPKESTVACRVTALSESYSEVGVRTVEIGPADQATRRVTVTVPTTGLPVTGTVESCELVSDARS